MKSKVVILGFDPELWVDMVRSGWTVAGYTASAPWRGWPEGHLGDFWLDGVVPPNVALVCGANDVAFRAACYERYSDRLATFISKSATVFAGVEIGIGCVIMAFSTIGPNSRIGPNSKIGFRAAIHHDVQVGTGVTVGPSVVCLGNAQVGVGAFLGAGSQIRERCIVGEQALVGMGSVVVSDIPAGFVAYGNPARCVRHVEK